MSGLSLAFVGDAVYSLLVREYLSSRAEGLVKDLHAASSTKISARAQAEAARLIMPLLTADELDIFKRGRNAHTSHTPKGARTQQYHAATGLEALFGYLYLSGKNDRIKELFNIVFNYSGENN